MTLLSSAAAVSPDLLRGRMESSRRPSALARAAILPANCYTCVTFIKNLVVWTPPQRPLVVIHLQSDTPRGASRIT